ncbi:MAG: ATP-binding protein [Ferruginibacter sp.]
MHGQDLEQLKIVHISELLNSRMEIQEQTLDSVSREIHDNIGQKLTLAKLNLNVLMSPDGKFHPGLQKTSSIIGCVIAELRDLSRSMNSELMLDNGLINALQNEANHLRKFGLFEVDLIIEGERYNVDAKTELLLFRITQESVNNIIKHAEAKKIVFKLNYLPFELILNISDDGKGFRLNEIQKGGMGILNIEKRCMMMGATHTIESEDGMGTIINLKIPYNGSNKEVQSNVG